MYFSLKNKRNGNKELTFSPEPSPPPPSPPDRSCSISTRSLEKIKCFQSFQKGNADSSKKMFSPGDHLHVLQQLLVLLLAQPDLQSHRSQGVEHSPVVVVEILVYGLQQVTQVRQPQSKVEQGGNFVLNKFEFLNDFFSFLWEITVPVCLLGRGPPG